MTGDVEGLKEIIDIVDDFVSRKDSNGWTPLHEGARGGHTNVVKILIERGADVNELTNHGETPLYLAVNNHGDDHPMVIFLRNLGGISLGPEL
jgi:ankyrin repeat protein